MAAAAPAAARECLALAVLEDSAGQHRKHTITRRAPGENDVSIDIKACGICHSDLHHGRGDWGTPAYPCVTGHEIAGEVSAVGAGVSKFAVGDRVGVGCFVDSCRECPRCLEGDENYCEGPGGMRGTYGDKEPDGGHTYGGYSQRIVVDENYVIRIPDSISLQQAAPLLCAGITLYSPLRYLLGSAAGPEKTVAILGLGGLGHMGVKLAHAMGCRVLVFSSSPHKAEKAMQLGADGFINHRDAEDMKRHAKEVDLLIDTVSAPHEVMPFCNTLKYAGTICLVGAPPTNFGVRASTLFRRRLVITGSLIGGIRETQEMIDFCAEHNITPDIDVIHPREVNRAWDALEANTHTESRFVIDIENGLQEGDWEVDIGPAADAEGKEGSA